MFPYLFVTIPIAMMAIVTPMHRRMPIFWGLAFVVVVVFVGLRHHVGMDWNNYLFMIQKANIGSWWQSFNVVEPGYATLLWIAGQHGWGIYGAYSIGTLIFAAGLFRYASTTPAPWIALLVAMPYLVIVISMSAARQAVAAGVLLWLVADWSRASVQKRVMLILLAGSFHFSAVIFLAFVLLDLRLPIWVKVAGTALMVGFMVYITQHLGSTDHILDNYIIGQTELTKSTGALFHVLLNGGPALMCFFFSRRDRATLIPDVLHNNLVTMAILLIPLALVASTAASRMTIYLFPVSMWIFAAFPLLLKDSNKEILYKIFLGIFFVGLMIFWMSAGNSAIAYLNYQNVLFISDYELVLCCK